MFFLKQANGGYVFGLGRNNFQIFEDGALQEITEFSSRAVPVAIGLVMDDNGSMGYSPEPPERLQ